MADTIHISTYFPSLNTSMITSSVFILALHNICAEILELYHTDYHFRSQDCASLNNDDQRHKMADTICTLSVAQHKHDSPSVIHSCIAQQYLCRKIRALSYWLAIAFKKSRLPFWHHTDKEYRTSGFLCEDST